MRWEKLAEYLAELGRMDPHAGTATGLAEKLGDAGQSTPSCGGKLGSVPGCGLLAPTKPNGRVQTGATRPAGLARRQGPACCSNYPHVSGRQYSTLPTKDRALPSPECPRAVAFYRYHRQLHFLRLAPLIFDPLPGRLNPSPSFPLVIAAALYHGHALQAPDSRRGRTAQLQTARSPQFAPQDLLQGRFSRLQKERKCEGCPPAPVTSSTLVTHPSPSEDSNKGAEHLPYIQPGRQVTYTTPNLSFMTVFPSPYPMATIVQTETIPQQHIKTDAIVEVREVSTAEKPSLLIIYGEGQEILVSVIADVLGQHWELGTSMREAAATAGSIICGLSRTLVLPDLRLSKSSRTVINTHCVDGDQPLDEGLSELCDYEYLYTKRPFIRRDLARFLSFVLGQINPHSDLSKKARTTLISTTFPDVHAALPNLDILSVGADAVEIRVDLLKEPLPDGSFSSIPSLKYVGEQVMVLRQRSELPIIYTTRCTNENGRFPMDDPNLFFKYLRRAIRWGCEYIDVELWLPEVIRRALSDRKGNSKIISAFHDFSGNFKWTSEKAQELFAKGAVYGDVVKMIALVSTMQENYELEYFRNTIQAKYAHPPLSGLNMGPMGQLSRALNRVFTPITHPLLPMIAAPGQLSAAEINLALHSMGQMPKLDVYCIGTHQLTTQAMFFEKCFNELSLPHNFIFVEKGAKGSAEPIVRRPNFGGAFISPPVPASAPYISSLSEAATAIGQVDTVLVGAAEGGRTQFLGENATWKGIRATLSRDYVPSAYSGRAALVLASAESDAAAAVLALKSLGIGPVYTIGFRSHGPMAREVEPVRSVEDVKKLEQPFVIISALPAEKSMLVAPLLKHYRGDNPRSPNGGHGLSSNNNNNDNNINCNVFGNNGSNKMTGKVFVDLASGPRRADPLQVAASSGWTAYGAADVSAWTTVETLRLLVGQNVPYDFVRLASGRGGLY